MIKKYSMRSFSSVYNSKVLITGGTGYIGNYISKICAAVHPDTQVLSMSRNASYEYVKERDP